MTTTLAIETDNGLLAGDDNGRHNGEEKKQERLTLLRERRAIHVRRGQRALLARLLSAETATADDVYESVELPPNIDPRCLGAVPGSLSRAGIIRSLGYAKSERPERHASPIQVWELADRAAALSWLAEHLDADQVDDLPLWQAAKRQSRRLPPSALNSDVSIRSTHSRKETPNGTVI